MDFQVRISSSLLSKMGWQVPGYNSEKEIQSYLDSKKDHSESNQNDLSNSENKSNSTQTNQSIQNYESDDTLSTNENQLDSLISPHVNHSTEYDTAEKILNQLSWKNEGEKRKLPTLLQMIIWEAKQRDDFNNESNLALYEEFIASEKENEILTDFINMAALSLKEGITDENVDEKRTHLLGTIPDSVWNNPLSLSYCIKEYYSIRRGNGNYFAYQNCVEKQILGNRLNNKQTL